VAYTFKHGDRPLEGYVIQRGVGRGGFGEVYYAISDGGKELALKYLRDNPAIELRGVSHCLNLKSPHLVSVFDVRQSTEGEYFIVMEYVSGPSLRDLLIAEPNGLGLQKAAFFVREIGRGLAYLHDRGIVHRDLKPGNIFYEDGYVKIGDYGLSKFISVSRHSGQTASVGTVHYMAPEVGSGNYSRGVDIYALGVILYEMLLGKVPFEGSSLGEVLIKHLTEQPEVDELPQPFGAVIRKALAKDPKDRFQTVDEMVEAIFGVEDIQRSLAGFDPTSLGGTPRSARGEVDSPMPSPNVWPSPVRPNFGAPADGGSSGAQPAFDPQVLGGRLAKRFDRITQKLDKKLNKLAGRHGRMQAPPGSGEPGSGVASRGLQPARPADGGRSPGPLPAPPPPPGDRAQRIILAAMMALGLAVGVGILIGIERNDDEGILAGISSFLLVGAVSFGVLLSRWLLTARLSVASSAWASKLVLLACTLPPMFVASIPALSESRNEEETLASLGALLLAVLIAGWDKRLERGWHGQLNLGSAVGLAFFAGVLALMFQAEELALMAAAVAAASSMSVEALAWAFPAVAAAAVAANAPRRARAAQVPLPPRPGADAPAMAPPPVYALPYATAPAAGAAAPGAGGTWSAPPESGGAGTAEHWGDIPAAIPVDQAARGVARASNYPLGRPRPTIVRAFWGVAAFALAGGTIVLFLAPLLVNFERTIYDWTPDEGTKVLGRGPDHDAYMGVITGCVACFSFLIFALRKTGARRRPGFWKETLRPFLQASAMTGMGAAITALALPGFAERNEEFIGAVAGLVFASLLFVVLLFVRGSRPQRAYVVSRPFVNPPPAPVAPPVPEPPSSGGTDPVPGEAPSSAEADDSSALAQTVTLAPSANRGEDQPEKR